ncbi:MAG TPA: 6-phosphogluconolactonase [Miltoncostaeaceae bacterium]|nr:6-phosphogluconolactonase [Miltoncostaeaceae bacterium]
MRDQRIRVVADRPELDHAAAGLVLQALDQADGRLSLSLAGGSTPAGAYEILAAEGRRWDGVQLLFGDERMVPPDHPASNDRMAREALVDRIDIPPENVHRIRGELPPWTAAAGAEAALHAAVPERWEGWPSIDLVLLGMGPEGHTASLFPEDPALDERVRAYVPVHRPDLPQPDRVTITLPVLLAARRVVLLVDGEEKAPALVRALAGDPSVPAGRLVGAREVVWIATQAAAGRMSRRP